MSEKRVMLPRFIALRYVSAGKRSHLVSFMSAISVAGLAIGVAILITVLSVMNGFDLELKENILGIVPHVTIKSEENLSSQAWSDITEEVLQHPLVEAAAPVVEVAGVIATSTSSRGVLINGIDVAQESAISVIGRFMDEGRLEDLQDNRWGIVLGSSLAQRLNVSLGDRVDLFSTSISLNPITPLPTFRSFEVTAIFRVGTQELDNDFVMINLDSARALFRMRTPYNGLRLRATDVLLADQVRSELSSSLNSDLEYSSWTAQFGSIYENIRFSRTIISFMLWLLVGVAAFNLIVSLIMIVRDKRGDIAILRTLGASPTIINQVFMWQGCLIAAMGISVGVVLGVIGSLQISEFALFIEQTFTVQILNAEVYPIDFLPSQLSLVDVGLVVAGVFMLSLLATIYPARRAAAIQPAEALRDE